MRVLGLTSIQPKPQNPVARKLTQRTVYSQPDFHFFISHSLPKSNHMQSGSDLSLPTSAISLFL